MSDAKGEKASKAILEWTTLSIAALSLVVSVKTCSDQQATRRGQDEQLIADILKET